MCVCSNTYNSIFIYITNEVLLALCSLLECHIAEQRWENVWPTDAVGLQFPSVLARRSSDKRSRELPSNNIWRATCFPFLLQNKEKECTEKAWGTPDGRLPSLMSSCCSVEWFYSPHSWNGLVKGGTLTTRERTRDMREYIKTWWEVSLGRDMIQFPMFLYNGRDGKMHWLKCACKSATNWRTAEWIVLNCRNKRDSSFKIA